MIISRHNNTWLSKKEFSVFVKKHAIDRINLYTTLASELILNNYLQSTYGYTLKNACKFLVLCSTIQYKEDNNVIITWTNKYADRLARLITYGTGVIPGTKMLVSALS